MGNANTSGALSSLNNATMRRDIPLGLQQAVATGNKEVAQYVRDVNLKRADLDLRGRFASSAATTAPSIDTLNTTNNANAQDPLRAKYNAGGGSPTDDLAAARAAGAGAPSNRAVARKTADGYASRLLGR